jgi:hypothetical protein
MPSLPAVKVKLDIGMVGAGRRGRQSVLHASLEGDHAIPGWTSCCPRRRRRPSHLHFLDLLLGTQADARRERAVARRSRVAHFCGQQDLGGVRLQTHGIATLLDVRQAEQLVFTSAESIPELQQPIEQTQNQIPLLLSCSLPRHRRQSDDSPGGARPRKGGPSTHDLRPWGALLTKCDAVFRPFSSPSR